MKINSQELVQSYVLTTAKYDFSVYEKRVLYRLIEMAQADMKGKKLKPGYQIGETLFKDKIIIMPLNAFLKDEKDQNYSRVKQALTDLRNKTLEYDDGDVWRLIGIIEKPSFTRLQGYVEFEVQPMIWKAILNFAKGFSKYEIETAMSFDSTFSMRFYELFSNNLRPQTITIDDLKKRFKIENKYKNRPADFIRFVIKRAKEELDAKAPFSFEYEALRTGRKITAIRFIPYRIPENQNTELEKKKLQMKTSVNFELPLEVSRYLIEKFDFDHKGLRANIELLKTAYLSFDLLGWLSKLHLDPNKVNNKPAYIIGALRNYIDHLEKKKREREEASQINDLANRVAKSKKI